jgi:hypothetical protein
MASPGWCRPRFHPQHHCTQSGASERAREEGRKRERESERVSEQASDDVRLKRKLARANDAMRACTRRHDAVTLRVDRRQLTHAGAVRRMLWAEKGVPSPLCSPGVARIGRVLPACHMRVGERICGHVSQHGCPLPSTASKHVGG